MHSTTPMLDAFFARQRLLVVAPHCDDETIQAGGLIQRVKAAGGEAYVIVMSVGELDHYTGGKGSHVEGSTRTDELDAAMKLLAVDDYEIALPDSAHMQLDALPRRELVHTLERGARLCTDNIKPTMVVLPAPSYNQDHSATYHAGLTTLRPHPPALKAFAPIVLVADAPQLGWGAERVFTPNIYITLTDDQLERKLAAYRCHATQVRPEPAMGSVEALRRLAAMRGMEVGAMYAEAFELRRFVG